MNAIDPIDVNRPLARAVNWLAQYREELQIRFEELGEPVPDSRKHHAMFVSLEFLNRCEPVNQRDGPLTRLKLLCTKNRFELEITPDQAIIKLTPTSFDTHEPTASN